ncbi:MAG: DegT/DnrJ/EryC1/StrS aminotransferase family protein, partial [Chromatiaceae bacterium]|nr:DegT/DnrJ/EryC1/StrS aminotransferase family protein [Chromatiaceae bacterium]
VWRRAWSFKDHGKDFDAVQAAARDITPGVPWVHRSLGSNWRMAGVQAAIGRVQLRKLEAWHAARLRNAMRFHERLSSCSALRIPMPPVSIRHAFYRFYAFVRPERLRPGSTRNDIVVALHARGVPCNLGSCSEIYREQAFSNAGFGPGERLPVAQALGETGIALLVHPTLESPHIDQMADAVLEVMSTLMA